MKAQIEGSARNVHLFLFLARKARNGTFINPGPSDLLSCTCVPVVIFLSPCSLLAGATLHGPVEGDDLTVSRPLGRWLGVFGARGSGGFSWRRGFVHVR